MTSILDCLERSVFEPQRKRDNERLKGLVAVYGVGPRRNTPEDYVIEMMTMTNKISKWADQRVTDKLTAQDNKELRPFVETTVSRLELFLKAVERRLT